MTLISGPAIARLALRTRKWAHDGIRRGFFGEPRRHRGILFVPVNAVEAYFGLRFSTDQIEQAREGRPDRVLTISGGNTYA